MQLLDAAQIEKAQRQLSRRCPQMRALIRAHGRCTLKPKSRELFHVMAAAIIGQQLSVKAADTIQQRVHVASGAKSRLRPAHILGLDHQQLRSAGLSNAKAKWLLELARRSDCGEFNFAQLRRMSDEDAINALDALPGVGRWTAEMFLIFALGRPDIFSLGDVGLRNNINRLYNNGEKLDDEATLAITERWRPYRSVASWYLWKLTDVDIKGWS